MSLKVLHLVEYLYQGGIERFLCEIGRLIPATRLDQTFFAYEMNDFIGAAKELKLSGKDVRIYKKNPGYDFNLLRELSRVVHEKNIEIIHTHDFGPIEYAVALKILNPRLHLVHTQHTLHHFVTNAKYLLFFQFASFFYKRMIAVSSHVKDVISNKCKYIHGSLEIVHNGVDVERFYQAQNGENMNTKLRLVSISRISPEKNLRYILLTCKKLRDCKIDFHLHHAGTGSQEEVDKILDIVEGARLSSNVTLHGYQDDIREVLKLGDIFVSSSLTEGHPIAVLEAMASGKLCICSEIPPHQDISPEGIILFKLSEEDALFNTLINIRNNKINSLEKIIRAKNDISQKYTLQQMITHYIDIYSFQKHRPSTSILT